LRREEEFEFEMARRGFEEELTHLIQPQIDWRTYLWRYLVRTPTDFTGFDRRFIGQKLYLEALERESVKVYIAVDTSGSVGDRELGLFLGEVRGILQSYPHLVGELYYADADAYGLYELNSDSPIPKPIGGRDTSFIPFFQQVKHRHHFDQAGVCVYLTDGFCSFPSDVPELPVLWVVTPGGLDLNQFPFGEAVRLLSR
jgi:predicted metal-dependent peptidase